MKLTITPGDWRFTFNPPYTLDGARIPGSSIIQAPSDTMIFNRNTWDSVAFMIHWRDDKDTKTVRSNATAIVTAVNETYKKGYNPAAMDELYKALQSVVEYLKWSEAFVIEDAEEGNQNCYTTAKTALQNAKL